MKKINSWLKYFSPDENLLIFWLALVGIVTLGFVLRTYHLTTPLADWHSWRQADTASVTREYIKDAAEPLIPEYHDLSNIPSGLENPEGYRMVEFPFVNLLTAEVVKITGEDLVKTSRLVSIVFSLGTILALAHITWRLSEKRFLALLSAGFFAFLPYSIYYSRVILPEPVMVATSVISFSFFLEWLFSENKSLKRWLWFGLSLSFLTISLLVKPVAIFMGPVFLVSAILYKGWKRPEFLLFGTSLIPLWWWRDHIKQFPAGIPASDWLFNGNGIRLKPAWWRWLFADRLGRLILGYWGGGFLLIGLIKRTSQKISNFDWITFTWAGSALAYLIIFATGNVQHDYYQVPLTPILAILLARGFYWLWESGSHKLAKKIFERSLVVGVLLLMLAFSWYEVKGYFNINNPALAIAGQQVDKLTPADALVIAPYGGDTAFLFQTNRRGWPIGFEIDKKIEQGATHYMTTTYDDEARELEAKFQTLDKTDLYLLLDLTQEKE